MRLYCSGQLVTAVEHQAGGIENSDNDADIGLRVCRRNLDGVDVCDPVLASTD